jgi:CBS domain-containing protein
MNISSICTRRMVTVDGDSTLLEAATKMREQHVGALIVTRRAGADSCVAGVVTDRDLVLEVLARGLNPAGIKIGDLASDPVASVPEDADLADGMAIMESHGVRRVLVTDAQDRIIGIVSLDDVMDACAQELAGLSRVIRSGLRREASELDGAAPASPLPLRIPSIGTAGWNSVLE